MRRVLLCLALLGCEKNQPSEESSAAPKELGRRDAATFEVNQRAVKEKALEAAQLAAREAEAAAAVATAGAEQAKQEMLAARDELAKTSAERAKLADEGRRVLAAAREKLGEMEMQIARIVAKRDAMRDTIATMTAEQKQHAAAELADIEKTYTEAADQLRRLQATMAELEKSLAP